MIPTTRAILFLACLCSLLVVFGACHREERPKAVVEAKMGPVIPWQPAHLKGLQLSPLDEGGVEQMVFMDGGFVGMTLGSKGALTAPIFHCKLNDGILVITSDSKVPYEELSLISVSSTMLIAKRKNGQVATYAAKRQGLP